MTGAEALYADMGHFGRQADPGAPGCGRAAGAAANYSGRGRCCSPIQQRMKNPFFRLAPPWLL